MVSSTAAAGALTRVASASRPFYSALIPIDGGHQARLCELDSAPHREELRLLDSLEAAPMSACSPWICSLLGPVRRFLADEDSRLGGLLRAVAGREAPSMTAAERLIAITFAVMLVTMVASAILLPGTLLGQLN